MGKPSNDFWACKVVSVLTRYIRLTANVEERWKLAVLVLDLSSEFGIPIANDVRWEAINGPQPDSDDDRSSGAPTPRYHPADLYADESEELLLLAAHAGGGSTPLLEE